jgi:hypothetical protein
MTAMPGGGYQPTEKLDTSKPPRGGLAVGYTGYEGSTNTVNPTPTDEKLAPYTAVPDVVNHPSHYLSLGANCSCGRPIECLDVTRHLNFNLGNAIKYIWRSEHKGKQIEDLKKAVFYLNDEIKRWEVICEK